MVLNHIMAVCKVAFYHLQDISHLRKYLSSQTAEMLMYTRLYPPDFIIVTHYCMVYQRNHLRNCRMFKMQQPGLFTHTCKLDHITPVLFKLQWLRYLLKSA